MRNDFEWLSNKRDGLGSVRYEFLQKARKQGITETRKGSITMSANLERLCEWLDWDSDEEFDDVYEEEDDEEVII
jgi:hypothetical protein